MTILFAALAAALGLVWGAFWGLVRDQDGPYLNGPPPGSGGNKWKEAQAVVFGLPAGLLWLASNGVGTEAMIVGALIWASMSAAFTKGHAKGLGMQDDGARWAMTWTGAIVTLGPALALAWSGAFILAPLVLLSGAAKVGTYMLGYRLRGVSSGYPHATEIGAILHGAIAYAVTAAALVLA